MKKNARLCSIRLFEAIYIDIPILSYTQATYGYLKPHPLVLQSEILIFNKKNIA